MIEFQLSAHVYSIITEKGTDAIDLPEPEEQSKQSKWVVIVCMVE